MSQIASTYKARDIEEWIDRYFYRPIGYGCARVAQAWSLTPNAVTAASTVCGVAAGHLFFYPHLSTGIAGMLLLVFSEALDSADGQLARMTGHHSRFGRILDGVGSNLTFLSIYVHLCLRVMQHDGQAWVIPLAVVAAASHSFQCALADYYRNAYLWFVYGEERSELDSSFVVSEMYRQIQWRTNPVRKCILRVYLNYTRQQEWCVHSFLRLREAVAETGGGVSPAVRNAYARHNKPLIKYYNLITANTRIIALCCAVIAGVPVAYFFFEILVLNAVLIGVSVRQNRTNGLLLVLVRGLTLVEARTC
jgi:phosphatidylglycerophosphate synthase